MGSIDTFDAHVKFVGLGLHAVDQEAQRGHLQNVDLGPDVDGVRVRFTTRVRTWVGTRVAFPIGVGIRVELRLRIRIGISYNLGIVVTLHG